MYAIGAQGLCRCREIYNKVSQTQLSLSLKKTKTLDLGFKLKPPEWVTKWFYAT